MLESGVVCGSIALALLNGFAPYLGLNSNLQVEGGQSNHVFMPTWQPFGFLRDVVVVLNSDLQSVRDFHSFAPMRRQTLGALADENGFSTQARQAARIAGPLSACCPTACPTFSCVRWCLTQSPSIRTSS